MSAEMPPSALHTTACSWGLLAQTSSRACAASRWASALKGARASRQPQSQWSRGWMPPAFAMAS